MTMFRKILGLLAVAAALSLGTALPAFAAVSALSDSIPMCAPKTGAQGARLVTNPSTTTNYSLGSNGCALMQLADVAYFSSQGFTQGSPTGMIVAGPFTAQTTTSNSPILPANAVITGIVVQEVSGNAVTGGIDIGTAGSSGQQIVAAYAVGANAIVSIPQASILLYTFGTTGPSVSQQIFFNAHTNWTDTAKIYVTILYSYY